MKQHNTKRSQYVNSLFSDVDWKLHSEIFQKYRLRRRKMTWVKDLKTVPRRWRREREWDVSLERNTILPAYDLHVTRRRTICNGKQCLTTTDLPAKSLRRTKRKKFENNFNTCNEW